MTSILEKTNPNPEFKLTKFIIKYIPKLLKTNEPKISNTHYLPLN